ASAGDVVAADAGERDRHAATFGELDGVAHQVREDLAGADFVAIHDHGHARIDPRLEGQPGGLRARLELRDDVVHTIAQREGTVRDVDPTRLDARQVENVRNERLQRGTAVVDHLDVLPLIRGE